MPIYSDIAREDLKQYLEILNNMIQLCTNSFSKFKLLQIINYLYEYCLCFAYFELNPDIDFLNQIKLTKGHVHAYLQKYTATNAQQSVATSFASCRDKIAHLSKEYFNCVLTSELLSNEAFYSMLSLFNLQQDMISKLKVFQIRLGLSDTPKQIEI